MAHKIKTDVKHTSNPLVPIVVLLVIVVVFLIFVFAVPLPYQTTETRTIQVPYTYETATHGQDCDNEGGCRCTQNHWFFGWCTDCMCEKTGYRSEQKTESVTKEATLAKRWGWA
ncbi:MAG TPA: hypothetical protein VJH97_04110 [Candidatus Nanoarchaeia archaeon]|nr:hypothetical protein [Candidatus Nanoarchaeia archaeon]